MDHLSHRKTLIDPQYSRHQGKKKLSAATEMGFQEQWTYCFAWLADFLVYNITPSPILCPTYIFFKQKRHKQVWLWLPPTTTFHTVNIRTTDKSISFWLEEGGKRGSQGAVHREHGTKLDGGWSQISIGGAVVSLSSQGMDLSWLAAGNWSKLTCLTWRHCMTLRGRHLLVA